MIHLKNYKALRGSWALPDVHAIDAAIDYGKGVQNSNFERNSAHGASCCLLLRMKT
jgi:hypothetical protein